MEHENEDNKEAPVEQSQSEEVKTESKEKKGWFKKKEKPIENKQQVQQKPKKLFFKKKQSGEPGKIKRTISQWKRTLEVARKPGKDEFITSAKVSGMGIALLGLIGFIIFMVFHLVL